MTTFGPQPLSGSSNGLGIKVVATATTGTTIHTAVSGTSSWDEVWLWAYNGHTANADLTIEFGGVTVPDNVVVFTALPFKVGPIAVIPGWRLQNGLLVRAFASVANVFAVTGYVNRLT